MGVGVNKNKLRLAETAGFLGAGAALGLVIALACELSGHPWWALLMFLLCASGSSLLRAILNWTRTSSNRETTLHPPISTTVKLGLILLMTGATVATLWACKINPRDYAYAPLLPPVLLTATFFGFGYAVLAIVLCTAAGDYFFALPIYDFRITHVEDLVGLSVFAVLGAGLAWAMQQLIRPD